MKKHIIILFILSIVFASCGSKNEQKQITSSHDFEKMEDVRWSKYKMPINITIPEEYSLDDDLKKALELSISAWNSKFTKPIFSLVFTGPELEYPTMGGYLNDRIQTIVHPNSWIPTENNNAIAVTFVSYSESTKQISAADIVVNPSFNFFYSDDLFDQNKFDYQTVIIHELGHFIGLGHDMYNLDKLSIMNPYLAKGQKRRQISEKDIIFVKNLYKDYLE